MRRVVIPGLLAAALASGVSSEEPPADRFLAAGIQQVSEGSFEDALFSLDTAVRKLTGLPERTRDLVQAYVYLGAAYVGLSHEDAAKGKFRKALELDSALRLSPDQFPPKVIKVFDEQLLELRAVGKKRSAKLFLALGGAAAAGAVGVGAASRGSQAPANRPPSVTVGVTPPGVALAAVTVVTLSATGADADGDLLSYTWDLGDGSAGSGASVTHVYRTEGTYRVAVTADDGRGGATSTRQDVSAGTLTGAWCVYECCHDDQPDVQTRVSHYRCEQTGARVDCIPTTRDALYDRWQGTLADPRRVELELTNRGRHRERCSGDLLPGLEAIQCTTSTGGLQRFARVSGPRC